MEPEDLRETTKTLLSDVLKSSDPGNAAMRSDLMPSSDTRKLLGRLLRNATEEGRKAAVLEVGSGRHKTQQTQNLKLTQSRTKSQAISFEKRRLLESIKDFSLVLNQIIDLLDGLLSSYRVTAGDLHRLLESSAPSGNIRTSGQASRDSQALYGLRVKFQNTTSSLRGFQESVDSSNCVSVSQLTSVIAQLCTCGRSLIRHVQTLHNRLISPSLAAADQSSLYSFALLIEQFLGQLLSNSEFLLMFAFSSGHLPDQQTSSAVEKLRAYLMRFREEILESLEEKRRLVSLLTEFELQRRIREATELERSRKEAQSRLTYHRPDYRPKGFLLPLPLAKRRERMDKVRQRDVLKPQDTASSSRSVASGTKDPRVENLERRLATLEEQLKLNPQRQQRSQAPKFEMVPTTPFQLDDLFDSQNDQNDALPEKADLFDLLLDGMQKPSGLSEKSWQSILDEVMEEFSRKISIICDDIVEEIFVDEIKKLTD